ncbi:trypsin-like peptidase domain-containing protein [Streptomyces sp. NPDC051243]|uniref:nSTAND1 domain-containing NTPase n=1 Tax=Streptomyces sp. NPDC051243 TaxID=3365646 RepID=UPI00379C5A99
MASAGPRTEPKTPSELPTAVAQILGPDGRVAGAGFLVAEDVLVTCAHVVVAAGSGPGHRVLLSFPRVAGADGLEGEVLSGRWRAPEDEDVAFVRLHRTPAGSWVLPLGSAAGCRGHDVRSFGFATQAPREGHLGFGKVGDLLLSSGRAGARLQLTGANDLTIGFSGGPVLDEVTGLVIGMLTEITAADALARGQGIAYATPSQVLREIMPELAPQEVCPYRGLEPFTAEHARWFQGREEAVGQVLAGLARQRRLTLLLGPSGSGKSSLIQAGVLPALAQGAVPGSDRWLPVLARPRQDLLAEIERAGLPGARRDGITAAVDQRLRSEPDCHRVLLVVDQFEELLLQSADGRLQEFLGFIDDITQVAGAYTALSVILIMRDDFYPQLAALAPRLLEAATPGLLNVPGTLGRTDLHDIIVLPAENVGLRFQPGLPEQIISDVLASSPDPVAVRQAPVTVLPLLEMTLKQLWLRRHDGFLTHEAYWRIGAVSGSLTTWCDSALNGLSPGRQRIARRVLTCLVHPADPSRRTPDVRAQVPLDELRDLAAGPDGAPGRDFDAVIAALTRHRLIATQTFRDPERPDAPPGAPVAELIHDALIRDWNALREWVREDYEFQEWLNRTRERQRRWAGKRDPGDLLAGTALAEGVKRSRDRGLPEDIAAFLSASRKRQQDLARRRRHLIAVLAALLGLALIAAGLAVLQWRTAVDERQAALSRQLATQSRTLLDVSPDLSSLLAVQAYRASHTPEALAALRTDAALPAYQRLPGHTDTVNGVAFSPDGRTLATGSADGTARLWDTTTGTTRATLTGHPDEVASVAFSPDGHILATASADGTRLWDTATGKTRATLPASTGGLFSLAFSPDGRTLATAGGDGTAQLWDTTTGEIRTTLPGHGSTVFSVAFSPDGRTLATAGADNTGRLWDTRTGTHRTTLAGHTDAVFTIAFSPDGHALATGSADGTMKVWDATTGKRRTSLDVATGSVQAVAFSPDGRTLAIGGTNRLLRLWDLATGAISRTLIGHTDTVESVAFSPDGRTLATASDDTTTRLWDVSPRGDRPLVGHTDLVHDVAFAPDGRTLASAGADKTVRLWNVDTGTTRTVLTGHTDHVLQVAFSPDGRTLATAGTDTTVRLWDVTTGKTRAILRDPSQLISVAFGPDGRTLATGSVDGTVKLWDPATRRPRASLSGHSGYVGTVAFNPDGGTLATGGADKSVRLWDVTAGKARFTTRTPDTVHNVAFSPDGRTLATAIGDYSVRLLDASTGKTRTTLAGRTSQAASVTFSPDGRTLATADFDWTTGLWDPDTGMNHVTLIGQHADEVTSVAFSPDGRTLASGSGDKTVRLWHVSLPAPSEAIRKVCHAVNRDLDAQERTAYLPGKSSAPVCPNRR